MSAKLLNFLWLAPLLFVGCQPETPIADYTSVREERIELGNGISMPVRRFTYDGHEYINFGAQDRGGTVHNPDCPCNPYNKENK